MNSLVERQAQPETTHVEAITRRHPIGNAAVGA